MDTRNQPFFGHPQTAELLRLLDKGDRQVVQVVGPWGSGKSTLLHIVEAELTQRGRAVFSVSCRDKRDTAELGLAILATVRTSRFGDHLPDDAVVGGSAGGPNLGETTAILRRAGARMPAPVLLLDELDQAAYPVRMTSGVEQLLLNLDEWTIVVSTEPGIDTELTRTRRLTRIDLAPLALNDAAALVRRYRPDLPGAIVDLITDLAGGSPYLLHVLTDVVTSATPRLTAAPSLNDVFARLLDDVLQAAPYPDHLGTLIDEVALFGGRCDIRTLGARLGISPDMVRELVLTSGRNILAPDPEDGVVRLFHLAFRDFILTERIQFRPAKLTDLRFGSEAAENDDLLDDTYVDSRSAGAILDQHQSVVVGDRGSGKSALFRKLKKEDRPSALICPIDDTGDLLQRIVAADSWLDAQALRAAWLVVVASAVADKIPPTAPKDLRSKAADLRAALGFPTKRPSFLRRAVRTVIRPLLGAKLSFAVGPVTLQAQLPSGGAGRQGKALLDVDSFLADADAFLGAAGQRVVVAVDRIDEPFKYNRKKQEPMVQALLQAEAHINLAENIDLIVFLRTDLFELYDIQEKNKLVSRTLTLA